MMSKFDTERPLKNRKYEIAQRDRELCAGDRECSQDEEMRGSRYTKNRFSSPIIQNLWLKRKGI